MTTNKGRGYRCKACRQHKAGCKGRAYRKHGCATSNPRA